MTNQTLPKENRRLVRYDCSVFAPGTFGFIGQCACTCPNGATFMLVTRARRKGKWVTTRRPLCDGHAAKWRKR